MESVVYNNVLYYFFGKNTEMDSLFVKHVLNERKILYALMNKIKITSTSLEHLTNLQYIKI